MDKSTHDPDDGEKFVPTPPHIPNFAKKSAARSKTIGLTITIVLGTLLLGGAITWFVLMRLRTAPAAPATQQNTKVENEKPKLTAEQASTPETFKSTKLNIEFIHRKDWVVTESIDKTEVIVTSPKTSYQTPAGADATDVFTIKLRNGAIPEATQTTVQKAIATRDSVIIAYSQPSDQQRQYTNVTDAGTIAKTFNFMIVSGSTAYKAGQVLGYGVPLTGQAYMFAGGYGADKDDSLTFSSANESVLDGPIYTQALDIIKSLKIY